MSLESDLFERLIPDEKKLSAYGFKKRNQDYIYEKSFLDDDFKAVMTIHHDALEGHVYDTFSGDEYNLFRGVQLGNYAAKVKQAYVAILEDIAKSCFSSSYFVFPQSRRVDRRIEKTYGVKPVNKKEGIAYATREGKVFALIRYISEYDARDHQKKEILDVRTSHKLKYLKRKGVYNCELPRHSQWISMTMDGSVRENFIYGYLEESYRLAGGRASYKNGVKEWIMPIAADFNVESYFRQMEISWRQRANYQMGDIIYVYVGKPYSCILYKCIVKMTNISGRTGSRQMILVPLEKYARDQYPLSLLKKCGIPYVRGPRYMTEELSALINQEK